MNGIVYDINATNIPGLVKNYHDPVRRGFAYETESHFIHFYAYTQDWYMMQPHICIVDPSKEGTLMEWVKKYFEATNIQQMNSLVGSVVEGVWRPGLIFLEDIYRSLKTTEFERKSTEQSLRILLQKLDEILLFIELNQANLNVYSHKTRELLILACTEIESSWITYLDLANQNPTNRRTYTTQDYVKLKEPLFLSEFECSLKGHNDIPIFRPFLGWDATSPTQSLPWYDAYNKTKHNRRVHFSEASLGNAIESVIANIIMYIIKFGPFSMLEEIGHFNSLINQYFRFRLNDSNILSHYIPKIEVPKTFLSRITSYSPYNRNHNLPYMTTSLLL